MQPIFPLIIFKTNPDRVLLFNPQVMQAFGDHLGACVDPQFIKNAPEMGGDRPRADLEHSGDRFVGQPLGNQVHDF